MAQTSFRLEDEVNDLINSQVRHDYKKADWLRDAVKLRLQTDPILDEIFEEENVERRREFVEAAVKKEVDRVKENPNYDGPAERTNHKKNH